MIISKMQNKEIKSWTIYLWRNGDKYEGAAPAVTRDGIKELYCFGWEIERDPDAKRNEDKHKSWRAKIKVKNLLNNTLNVINWYGKKVLDSKGNVDPNKLSLVEIEKGTRAFKQGVTIDDLYPIKKFPFKEITLEKAKEYNFK